MINLAIPLTLKEIKTACKIAAVDALEKGECLAVCHYLADCYNRYDRFKYEYPEFYDNEFIDLWPEIAEFDLAVLRREYVFPSALATQNNI